MKFRHDLTHRYNGAQFQEYRRGPQCAIQRPEPLGSPPPARHHRWFRLPRAFPLSGQHVPTTPLPANPVASNAFSVRTANQMRNPPRNAVRR